MQLVVFLSLHQHTHTHTHTHTLTVTLCAHGPDILGLCPAYLGGLFLHSHIYVHMDMIFSLSILGVRNRRMHSLNSFILQMIY